jgi:hypothetical protein
VDVVAAVGADEEPAAVVEPREGAFDDPAVTADPGAVFGLAAGDHGLDPSLPDQPPVLVMVVAAVGEQRCWPFAWPSCSASHGRDSVEEVEQLADVVAVAAGQRPGERSAVAVYEEVVLTACPAAVNGAGTRFRAPFFAWM